MSIPPLTDPYSGRLTIEPHPGLSDDHRAVERQLAELVQNEEACDRLYAAIGESQGGKIINIDYYRNLIPEYAGTGATPAERRLNRTALTHATYSPAKVASRNHFRRALLCQRKLDVTIIGGGPASGKSTATAVVMSGPLSEHALVYDTSLANPDHCEDDVHETLRRHDEIDLLWVYCPFQKAIQNMIGRAVEDGRFLTLSRMVQTHQGSRASILRVIKVFDGDIRARIAPINRGAEDPDFDLARLQQELYATETEVNMTTAIAAFNAYVAAKGALPKDLHDAIYC